MPLQKTLENLSGSWPCSGIPVSVFYGFVDFFHFQSHFYRELL